MVQNVLSLILSLCIILFSCELFTNGIEWLGKKLKLGDGVVGSIFSAVGTCLPETMIPIIAILFTKDAGDSIGIGIGAILGAPFMLGTLAFFVTGVAVLAFWRKRKTGMKMHVNTRVLSRDIGFFIVVYTIGLMTALLGNNDLLKQGVAFLLIAFYVVYIIITVRQDTAVHGELEPLYMTKLLKIGPNMVVIFLQIALALLGIILGAELFVGNTQKISETFNISAMILSLIITPIATELPEKFNSVIWISKRKDTLALGNITGAMVFQSCIPVSVGMLFTPWHIQGAAVLSAVLAISSAVLTYIWLKTKKKLNPIPLLMGGVFYAIFIIFLCVNGFK